MNPIEDYIRKKLGAPSSPPEVDAEDLWESIAGSLPEEGEELAPTSGSSGRGWRRWVPFVLGGVVLLGVMASWWWAPPTVPMADSPGNVRATQEESDKQNSVAVGAAAAGEAFEAAAPVEVDKEPPLALGQPFNSSASSALQKLSGDDNQGASPGVQSADDAVPSVAPDAPINGKQENNSVSGTDAAVAVTAAEEVLTEPEFIQAAEDDKPGETLTNSDAIREVVAGAVHQYTEQLPALVFTEEFSTRRSLPEVNVAASVFRARRQPRLSAGVHLGSNVMLRRYAAADNETIANLNAATGQMAGQTAALDARYRFAPNFTLGVGIDYHRTGNTFQFVSEWDTLVPHPTPPNTGMISAVARRTVAHNNREERISIPVLLSYERQFGDFTAGVGAGAGFNWQTNASGRTLNTNGRIVAYDAPLQRRFFLSWQVQPRLSWQPNPEKPWELQLRVDAARFRLATSPQTSTQAKGWLLGAVFGVRYRLEK